MGKWGIGFKCPPSETCRDGRFCGVYGEIGSPERWPTREKAQAKVDELHKIWADRGSEVTYWVVDLEEAGYE
jgi:hypothetical protein